MVALSVTPPCLQVENCELTSLQQYVSGSNNAPGIDGSILSGSKTMIVVTVSYRLGLLGFMSSDSLGMDGNYGIKDVILALR